MSCPICNTRKPKRFCPAKETEICTVCCATGREDSIDCPLNCEHLRLAHRHKMPETEFDIETAPNRDIEITEAFLERFQIPLALLATALAVAAAGIRSATDNDAREALEEIIQQHRGRGKGLIVDGPSTNPNAQMMQSALQQGIDAFLQREKETFDEDLTGDADILKILVFLQRLEFANNNGRRLSRAFLGFLQGFRLPPSETAPVAE